MTNQSENQNPEPSRPERWVAGSFQDIFGDYTQPVHWSHEGRRHLDYPWAQFYVPDHWLIPYFWYSMVRNVLGREWLGVGGGKPKDSEHLIHEWLRELDAQWAADRQTAPVKPNGTFSVVPNRATHAIFRLGYEFFVLAARNVQLGDVEKGLRRRGEFLSARFEVAIGAFFCLAGFEVEYIRRGKQQTPDLKVSNRWLEKPLHVEVKRKDRTKSEHDGPLNAEGEWRLRIRDRLMGALDQLKCYPRPWCVCIDLDLGFPMPEPTDEVAMRAFFDAIVYEADEAVEKMMERASDSPQDGPDMITLVQVPYNSDGAYAPGRPYQFLFVVPQKSSFAKDFAKIALRLQLAVTQFNRIPSEWDHFGKCRNGPPPDLSNLLHGRR